MKVPEFYPERQGRPITRDTVDLESGQTIVQSRQVILWEEYMELKEMMERLLEEHIAKTQELLIEAKQIKLHLASMSGENIDEESIE